MNRASVLKISGSLLAIGAAAAVAVPAAVSAQSDNATTIARADLRQINGTGARGQATLRLSADKRTLTVQIMATGLERGGVHLSHIHGLSQNGAAVESVCPTKADDVDGDGFVELAEGLPKYGPILVDFSNVDPDGDGRVNFRKTIELTSDSNVVPLSMRHIVIHGMSVPAGAGAETAGPAPNEVDGTAGFKVLLPVLCGEIRAVGGGNMDAMKFRTAPGHSGH